MSGSPLLWWLYLLLSVRLQSTTTLSDSLFLLVENVEEVNNSEVNNSEVNDSNQTGQCEVGTDKLNCLCGKNLADSYDRYREELARTCRTYNDIRENSQLSFCEETFLSMGYNIQVRAVASVKDSSNITDFYNSSELSEKIRSLEDNLEGFKGVLDRTIIGVLIRTDEDRCYCLDNYKKWLCTMLPVYMSPSSSSGESGNLSSVVRVLPCLTVCHKVLQNCPYYLPSQFQQNSQVIYGGYPAFDCPRDAEPDYAVEGSLCIGESGGVLHEGVAMVMILSLTFYMLAIWSVT